jgi:hypothetical protein
MRWGRAGRVAALIALTVATSGMKSCGFPSFRFLSPEPGQLSLSGPMKVSLLLPPIAEPGTLAVTLDGRDVTAQFAGDAELQHATLAAAAGAHALEARVDVTIPYLALTFPLTIDAAFESVDLFHPDECEILNQAECLLPFPSSRFLVPDPATQTGWRAQVPQIGMPPLNGPPFDVARLNVLDGFSPTVQILMHFPGGVSVEKSSASRLLAPGCCGQPPGTPYVRTRTHDGRSLEADSPTVLVDADTGERILHWMETDARAAGNPARQTLMMHPARSLEPGHRYLVAIRKLVRDDGSPVAPEPVFAALRDRRPTDIPAVLARRAAMEDVFARLEAFGIPRDDLLLAWDFRTRSDHQLTHQMLSMRDQAFAWLATVEADPGHVPFTVTSDTVVTQCASPTDMVWRDVRGTYRTPLFLETVPIHDPSGPASELVVDASDTPVQNGFMDAPFTISIPCAARDPQRELHPLVIGHGIFQKGEDLVTAVESELRPVFEFLGMAGQWNAIAGGTDWQGLCCHEGGVLWTAFNIIGIITNQLNHFEALPDRTKQGQANTLVLARMMKRGIFNRHPAFQVDDGQGGMRGLFPGERDPANEMFYFGISLGGINGTYFAALTPDIERFNVDVPLINFTYAFQRSIVFGAPITAGISFESLVQAIGLTDPMHALLGYGGIHELWVSGEPAGYATHVTRNPLPGSGVGPNRDQGKKILMTVAWLDKQVPGIATEAMARTLGLPQLRGSVMAEVPEIPDVYGVPGPVESAYVVYDQGTFDLFDPAHQPFIPPLANLIPSTACDPHSERFRIPAAMKQAFQFLQPGGTIENFCADGVCDGSEPFEIPRGLAAPCQLPIP